jgi:hypothetical protein
MQGVARGAPVPYQRLAEVVRASLVGVERELESTEPGSPEAVFLQSVAAPLRSEYQRLLEQARESGRPEPPPLPDPIGREVTDRSTPAIRVRRSRWSAYPALGQREKNRNRGRLMLGRMRPRLLAMLVAVLLGACALVQPPPPPGTQAIPVPVLIRSSRPVDIAVTSAPSREALPGAVAPASLPGKSITQVTFYVPAQGTWLIVVNGKHYIEPQSFFEATRPGCTMSLFVTFEAMGVSCVSDPED